MTLDLRTVGTALMMSVASLFGGEIDWEEQDKSRRSVRRFAPKIGHWEELSEDGKPVFLLDSRKWKRDPADEAFPVAVSDETEDFSEGTLRVRFKLIAGASDQSAGLVFNYSPAGEYLFVRYNTREGNAALWRFANGKRAAIAKGGQQLQLPLDVWHEIVVHVTADSIVGIVNDTLRVEHKLGHPVRGQIGFWGKHDAVSAFTDLRVEPVKTERLQ